MLLPVFPIFPVLVAAFGLFSVVYGIIGAAIMYHLRAHSVSGRLAPHVVTLIFLAVSIMLWFLAVLFLFRLPH